MNKEIRKSLERNLPQYVLDYLTTEFSKIEETAEQIKRMQEKEMWLLEQIAQKDQQLMQMFRQGFGNSQSQSFEQPYYGNIGRQQGRVRGFEPQSHYDPYFPVPYSPEYRGGYEGGRGDYRGDTRDARDDRRGDIRGERGRNRNETNEGQGGGSQGGRGGSQGATLHYFPFNPQSPEQD